MERYTSAQADLHLAIYHRSPDEAKIKTKMLYASSKDALRRALVGVAIEIQGTDHSEVAYEASESCVSSLLSPPTSPSLAACRNPRPLPPF